MNKLQLFFIMMVSLIIVSCGGAVEYVEDYSNPGVLPCADASSPDSGMMVIGDFQQGTNDGGNSSEASSSNLSSDANIIFPRKCMNENQVWCENFQACFDSSQPYFCVSLNKENVSSFIIPEPRWFTVLDAVESCPTNNTEIRRLCSSEETVNGTCNSCEAVLFSASDLYVKTVVNITSTFLCPYGVLGYCIPEPTDVPLGTQLFSVAQDNLSAFNSLENACKQNGFKFVITCEQISKWRIDYL